MNIIEELGDKLAADTLAAIEKTGDESLTTKVAAALGSSSPTLQEVFQTSIRIRSADARGRDVLKAALANYS